MGKLTSSKPAKAKPAPDTASKPDVKTEALTDAQLEQATGGAIDSYMFFGPKPK